MLSNVSPYLSLCSTITAFTINHRREQHCFSHSYSFLSLSFSLSHSLTAISCTSEHHLFSSTAQFHLCLLPVDYCGTVARWLRSCRSANVTTSVRPSVHRRNCCVALPLPKEGLAEEEENGKRGRHGREGAVRASRAHSYGKESRHYILSLICTSAIMTIQHQHQVDISKSISQVLSECIALDSYARHSN